MDPISMALVFLLSLSETAEPTEPVPQLQAMHLQTTVHVVNKDEIWGLCKNAIPEWKLMLGTLPVACAWIYPEKNECHAYVAKGDPVNLLGLPQSDAPNPEVVAHELKHCQGFDHNGDLVRQLAILKQTQPVQPTANMVKASSQASLD